MISLWIFVNCINLLAILLRCYLSVPALFNAGLDGAERGTAFFAGAPLHRRRTVWAVEERPGLVA